MTTAQAPKDPAFPTPQTSGQLQGITIRDYFATAWFTGLASRPGSSMTATDAANEAYRYADAMLKHRAG